MTRPDLRIGGLGAIRRRLGQRAAARRRLRLLLVAGTLATAALGATVCIDSRATPKAEEDPRDPFIVWDGSGYGVAWLAGWRETRVAFARFDAAGNAVTERVFLDSGPGAPSRPGVAWDGAAYAVTWTEPFGEKSEVVLRRVGADGAPVGDPLRIPERYPASARVVWTGQHYELAWVSHQADLTIEALSVSRRGEVMGPRRRLAYTTADTLWGDLSFIAQGDQLALAWASTEEDSDRSWWVGSVYRLRAKAGGGVGRLQKVAGGYKEVCHSVSIAWQGEGTAVLWGHAGSVRFATVAEDGHVSGPLYIGQYTGWTRVTLASSGRWFAAVWSPRKPNHESTIAFRRIAPDRSLPEGERRVVNEHATGPQIVWNDSEFAIGHVRGQSPDGHIQIARVTEEGVPVSGAR